MKPESINHDTANHNSTDHVTVSRDTANHNTMTYRVNEEAQNKRRTDAIHSAVVSSLFMLASGLFLLFLRWHYQIQGMGNALLLLFALLDLGMILPVWILLKKRLQEIEGGEEDVAAQY